MSELLRPEDRQERTLMRDQGGAIMILGLFMAVFLVAMLYYLLGVGEAIIYRESMQDASDAGSFAAAVMDARGMNLIVLLNIVMAVVMAVLIALKVVEVVLIAAMAIAIAASGPWCPCCGCPAMPTIGNMMNVVRRAINTYERIAKQIIRACDVAQEAIAIAWPLLAQARAVDMMSFTDSFKPPAKFGFVWPIWAKLPIEDHVFSETCARGGRMVGDIIAAPFRAIPVIGGTVASWVSGAVQGLVNTFSAYFCGTSGGDPVPAPTVETEVIFPSNDAQTACRDGCRDTGLHSGCSPCASDRESQACIDAREAVCSEAQNASDYSPWQCPGSAEGTRTTECSESEFRYVGTCDQRDTASERSDCTAQAERAASECNHDTDSRLRNYSYVRESRYVLWYKVVNPDGTCESRNVDMPLADTNENLRAEEGIRNGSAPSLCFRKHGIVRSPWYAACGYDSALTDARTTRPTLTCNGLLTEEEARRRFSTAANTSSVSGIAQSVPIVYEIYGCAKKVNQEIPIDVSNPPDTSDWKPPKQVSEGLYMGDDDFQLRGIAFGDAAPVLGDRGVAIASWGRSDGTPAGFTSALRTMSRLSIAQAEFYWNQDEAHDGGLGKGRIEWMWDMAWRARLRRVNFTSTEGMDSACSGAGGGGDCGSGGLSGLLSDAVVH
ncbi:MAG: hypothetical protein OEY14_06055 [Myxococcales bacterium]|nr:hypothetical protein [Myxococcales bacterium]